jgi:predicted nucleic acid-binding protein
VKVLFDTNVVLDVLLEREPHVTAAARLFSLVDNGGLEGSICATTATTVFYIAARSFGSKRAQACTRLSAATSSSAGGSSIFTSSTILDTGWRRS